MTVRFDSFFTVATREGLYPTVPVKSIQKCYGHMEISKRYKPGARTVVLSAVRGPLCFRMAVCDVNRGIEDGINHNAGAGAKGGRDNGEGSTHPRFR